MHFYSEPKGRKRRSIVIVRVEPGPDVSPRVAAESAHALMTSARAMYNGRGRTRLVGASLSVPKRDKPLMTGKTVSIREVLGSSEFRLPVSAGLVMAIVFTLLFPTLPQSQLPSAWWALAPVFVTVTVAIALVLALASQAKLKWTPE